jgi:hypothetical protein
MKSSLPTVSKIAIVLLVLLSVGPLITGLDLAFDFLPTKVPAIQHLHAAAPLGKALWVCAGFFGFLSVFLQRKPRPAALTALLFAIAYVLGATFVWLQFTPGCWLAIAAFVLTAIGSWLAMRANNSFKPKPLRGSA